jgi:hypothetical protein
MPGSSHAQPNADSEACCCSSHSIDILTIPD